VFCRSFRGEAKGIFDWYQISIGGSLKNLGYPMIIMVVLAIAGIFIGLHLTKVFPFSLGEVSPENWKDPVQSSLEMWPLLAKQNFLAFLGNNIRFMFLSLIAGMLSLGILGVLPTMATLAVTAYLVGTLSAVGLPGWQIFIGFILPHGWLEIGAGLLSSAVILRGGARLASPGEKKTIGEVFISSIADWFKIFVGLVLPALILAAVIEVWITPWIAARMLGG
jgi:uncharacterized membrane protein SpoIIM required for sporulation